MATPRTTASIHPTRQQLDELDALLQRMLELPVNAGAEEAPAQPPVPAPEGAGDRPESTRVIRTDGGVPRGENAGLDSTGAEDGEAWVPLRSSWQPSAQTW